MTSFETYSVKVMGAGALALALFAYLLFVIL